MEIFEERVGIQGAFERLSIGQKEVLLDYAFNGVLRQFKKFMMAVAEGDKEGAKKESKRYYRNRDGVMKELVKRNQGTLRFIDQTDQWVNICRD